MSFVEQPLFGREEIVVPAKLPVILKQFCKAAIRTQPCDLLKWSSSYFRALADGEEPPVKSRLEYPSPDTTSVLTLGFLRVLLRQFGNYNKTLPIETMLRRWDCLCLDRKHFDTIVTIGKFRHVCQVKKFLSVAAGLLGANLTETMIVICQLFTHEPDGGSAMIPLTLFTEIYEYLVELGSSGSEKSTFDHDTTECTTCTNNSVDGTCSITSRDTDVNVNLDVESTFKDEIGSSKIDLSTELTENSSLERESANCEKKDEILASQKKDGSNDANCTTEENITIGKKFCGLKDANGNRSAISEIEKDTKSTCYLNVPGLCSGLSAEQIAKVATWMLECAKLQEGMVGPRNIRHTNCPPLHKRSTSKT